MSDVIISVENLGKKYRIAHQAERQRYVALRDVIAQKCAAPFRWLRSTTRPLTTDHTTGSAVSSPSSSSQTPISDLRSPASGKSSEIMKNKACACIVGWHFKPDVYQKLAALSNLKLFVLSHKCEEETPDWLKKLIGIENILFRPNIGYDWGAYQQFIESGIYRGFSSLFFLHDDLEIKDVRFIEVCEELLVQGYKIIGNGVNSDRRNWFKGMSPAVYAHSNWLPDDALFSHKTVRGSFWATTREVIDLIAPLEIFWDRFHITDGFGNYSLIATCGKAEWLLGGNCITFLGDTYLESRFLTEAVRGGLPNALPSSKTMSGLALKYFLGAYRRLCVLYVFHRMGKNKIKSAILKPFVMCIASRGGSR